MGRFDFYIRSLYLWFISKFLKKARYKGNEPGIREILSILNKNGQYFSFIKQSKDSIPTELVLIYRKEFSISFKIIYINGDINFYLVDVLLDLNDIRQKLYILSPILNKIKSQILGPFQSLIINTGGKL